MGSLLGLPVRTFKLRSLDKQSKKLWRSKTRLVVSDGTPMPTSRSWPASTGHGRQHHIGHNREHIQLSTQHFLSLEKYHHSDVAGTGSLKGQSTVLSRQLLQNNGIQDNTSEFLNMGLLPHLFCCEVSSLIRSNVVWDTMMVGKAFSKPLDGSFSRHIICRKGKAKEKMSIPGG